VEIWVTASKKGKYFVLRLSFFLPKVLWIKKVCVILPLNLIVRFYKPLNFKNKKMIVVPVKEGENIEKALKKFKRKFEKTGIVKELRSRQQFDKPSVTKRLKKERAVYVQQLQQVED
jgi:small subunit ribosomal protein S21